MNRLRYCIIILTIWSFVSTGWAARKKPESAPLRLAIDLVDGSQIMGTPSIKSVPVPGPLYAEMDLPLKHITSIKIDDDHENVSLEMRNGDAIAGVINLEPFELKTAFGNVSVGVRAHAKHQGASGWTCLVRIIQKKPGSALRLQYIRR